MVKQLLKIGNSVAVTIPAEEVAKLKLKPGDKVEFYSDGESLKIVPIRKIRSRLIAIGLVLGRRAAAPCAAGGGRRFPR